MLMPLLVLYIISKNLRVLKFKLLLCALVLSWFGDVLLLLPNNQNAFSTGLVAFLCAHICYCIIFSQQFNSKNRQRWPIIVASLVVVSYVLLFFNLIQNNLADLKPAVMAYMAILALMIILSLWSYGRARSFSVIIAGACCFIASDSLLAIDKFIGHQHYLAALIIATYALAQFCLSRGIISEKTLCSQN